MIRLVRALLYRLAATPYLQIVGYTFGLAGIIILAVGMFCGPAASPEAP